MKELKKKKEIWFYRSHGRTCLMVCRFYRRINWKIGLFGIEISHEQPKELFITTWGPILERPFMLWLRWPLWGKSPKGIVLWRRHA